MARADQIFTLDGVRFNCLAAFDLILAVAPLKDALVLGRIDFWAFQKNNHASVCQVSVLDYSFEMPKNNFFLNPNATFNGTTVTCISKNAHNY